jgi:hypothetical protein
MSVLSNDEKVAYIEAGVEPHVERREVSKGERVTFLFPFSEQIDKLNPRPLMKKVNSSTALAIRRVPICSGRRISGGMSMSEV